MGGISLPKLHLILQKPVNPQTLYSILNKISIYLTPSPTHPPLSVYACIHPSINPTIYQFIYLALLISSFTKMFVYICSLFLKKCLMKWQVFTFCDICVEPYEDEKCEEGDWGVPNG